MMQWVCVIFLSTPLLSPSTYPVLKGPTRLYDHIKHPHLIPPEHVGSLVHHKVPQKHKNTYVHVLMKPLPLQLPALLHDDVHAADITNWGEQERGRELINQTAGADDVSRPPCCQLGFESRAPCPCCGRECLLANWSQTQLQGGVRPACAAQGPAHAHRTGQLSCCSWRLSLRQKRVSTCLAGEGERVEQHRDGGK